MRTEHEREYEPAHAPDAQRAVLQAVVALHAAQPASDEAAAQARRLLVDTVGCALAGRHAEEVRRLEAALAACEPGDFSLPAGPSMSVQSAAQVLAMAATWDEACEGHALAHGRPGVPLVAALLPLALRRGASLGEFVDAFVLGYEVGARCGAWLRIRPGMHVDANWPALGVAAGVARLLGLAPAGHRAGDRHRGLPARDQPLPAGGARPHRAQHLSGPQRIAGAAGGLRKRGRHRCARRRAGALCGEPCGGPLLAVGAVARRIGAAAARRLPEALRGRAPRALRRDRRAQPARAMRGRH
jgi:hypothetical protein